MNRTLPASTKSIESEIRRLREEVLRHEELYYARDDPEISDAEYDALMERLRLRCCSSSLAWGFRLI